MLRICSLELNWECYLRAMNTSKYYLPFTVNQLTLPSNHHIAYIDEGEQEEIILFIHGMGGFIPTWAHNIEVLSNKYRCIAIDLPGHGLSDKKNESFSLVFFAETIVAFIEKMGIKEKKITLCGHSMGGQIALLLCLRYPFLFQKLILIAPAGIEKFSSTEKMILKNSMHLLRFAYSDINSINNLIKSFFYQFPKGAEALLSSMTLVLKRANIRHYSSMISRSAQAMLDTPIAEFLFKIDIPTLIIFGEKDILIPNPYLNHGNASDIGNQAQKEIKNSKLQIIAKAGHFVHFEKPNEVNQAIVDFM